MANLQYVGARYVPIVFDNPDDGSAAWKSGISYENLVIVTYLDDSYTSRKPVPASVGDPASNPDYWAKTGDFNAGLVSLQNQINDTNERIDTGLVSLQNQINDTNGRIDTGLVSLQNRINDTNGRIDDIVSRKVVVIADSFGITPSSADNFIVKLKGFLGLSASEFVASAEGGCGYVNPSPNHHTFIDNLNTLLSGMTDDEKEKVSTFVVVGGVNDTRVDMNIDLYRPAVKNLFTTARAAFPNATMIAAYNGTLFHETFAAARRALKPSFSTQTAAKATEAGAAFLPLNVIMSAYGATGADGIHPSSAGADIIADSIINIMNGGGTLEIVNSWNKTPINFFGGTLNSKFQLANSSVLYDNAGAPLNISWVFTQLGTETGLPYPISNDTVIFRPFCLKITHADSTVDYKFDALLKFRNDGIYEVSIPSGTNNVVKIENFAAAAYAYVNTISDI